MMKKGFRWPICDWLKRKLEARNSLLNSAKAENPPPKKPKRTGEVVSNMIIVTCSAKR